MSSNRSSSSLAKSGWLYRQSSILKKWKLKWFVLSTDGYLRYYEVENGNQAGGTILIPVECTVIRSAREVTHVRAPEGLNDNFLLSIEMTNGNKWILCADSDDDMRAWQIALDQARLITHVGRPSSAPPCGAALFEPSSYTVVDDLSTRYVCGYPYRSVRYVHPSFTYYDSFPSTHYVYVPRHTTIYDYRRPYCGYSSGNLALGMVAGAALGTMMFTPLLFWC